MTRRSTAAVRPEALYDDNKSLELATRMMAIPGKSCNEGRVIEFIRQHLRRAGISDSQIRTDGAHRRSPAGGEVGNLIVKLRGTWRAPRRLLMAHVDTVPLCVGARPVRHGGVIESRDAQTALGADNRAGASVLLNTLLEITRRDLPHPPLTFCWPVQEEIGLLGARFVNADLLGTPRLCFNWDGGAPNALCIGATGGDAMKIEIEGIASHAGVHPERGVSAVAIAGLAIADLEQNGWHGRVIKRKQSGTSNIGVVVGGEATNVVTPRLSLRAEARSHNPAFRRRIVGAFERAFDHAAKSVKNSSGQSGKVHMEARTVYEHFHLSRTEPCVLAAEVAVRAVGMEPFRHISDGGLDANWMTAHGFPTVTLGCGQENVHTVAERLHVDMYLTACRIGLLLATSAD